MTLPPPAPMQPTPPPYGGVGQPGSAPMPPAPDAGRGPSIGSLVVGILSLLLCGLGVVLGPVAVVLGIVAGRKRRFNGMSVAGIVTGALGFVLSVIAIAIGVAASLDYRDGEATGESSRAGDEDVVVENPTGEVVLTEAGIAASTYASAWEAWADESDAEALGGMFAGDTIDTPCFSLAGEEWWVVQGDPDTCEVQSELWWETFSDASPVEIKLFGSGAAGAAISVSAYTQETLAGVGVSTLDELDEYMVSEFYPAGGCPVLSNEPATVAGQPAYVVECDVASLEHYLAYLVEAPRAYDAAMGAQYFEIRVYNESEWVYPWDDVRSRFESTFAWK